MGALINIIVRCGIPRLPGGSRIGRRSGQLDENLPPQLQVIRKRIIARILLIVIAVMKHDDT